jgi:hypothetical protein
VAGERRREYYAHSDPDGRMADDGWGRGRSKVVWRNELRRLRGRYQNGRREARILG